MSGKSVRRQRIKQSMRAKYFAFLDQLGKARNGVMELESAMRDPSMNQRKFRDRVMERWARGAA